MKNNYYVGDVFVILEVNENRRDVVNVYTNQYAADQVAWDFNQKAKNAGIPQRYAVICRSLYE